MRKLLLLGSIAQMFLFGSLRAETREIVFMTDILPSITQDTLVVLDLDNTVMQPIQTLGSEQWYRYVLQKDLNAGVDPIVAVEQSVEKFIQVHNVTRVEPTEQYTPQLIRNLQAQGIKVIALTARPTILFEVTRNQLASIGVDFSLQPISDQNFYIGDSLTSLYTNGIAFVGPYGNKGTELVKFLNQINQMPARIVFVDDTLKNIVNVENSLVYYPYEHISFHYNFDEYQIQKFNPAIAEVEWFYFSLFHILLNDEKAAQMLSMTSSNITNQQDSFLVQGNL